MKKTHLNSLGFTAIELLVCLLVVSVVAAVALTNIRSIRSENRDTASKSDINTLAFQLESFYQKNNFYPETLTAETLNITDKEVVKDSRGQMIGEGSSLYTYTPLGCAESKCKSFELTAQLEREAPYFKQSLNN